MNAITKVEPVKNEIKEMMRRAELFGLTLSQDEANTLVVFENRAGEAYDALKAADLTDELITSLRESLEAKPTLKIGAIERPFDRNNVFSASVGAALIIVDMDARDLEGRPHEVEPCRTMIRKNTEAFKGRSSPATFVPR